MNHINWYPFSKGLSRHREKEKEKERDLYINIRNNVILSTATTMSTVIHANGKTSIRVYIKVKSTMCVVWIIDDMATIIGAHKAFFAY